MKNLYGSLLLAITAVAMLGACQPKTQVVDFNKIAADRKTESAERLLYASGFMHADRQFDEALKLNPNDPVARFYKASLGPLMQTRGLATRVSGLVPQLKEADQEQFEQFKTQLPSGDLATFFLDGKPDINNEKDAQQFIRSIQDSLRKMRQVYYDLGNSKQHLTLHVTGPKPGYSQEDLAQKCKVTRVGAGQYAVEACDIKETKTIVLSYADFEALRLYAASAIIFLSAGTSYDLTGLINVLNNLEPKKHHHLSDARIAEAVSKENQLGNLVDVNVLKEVLGFGAEGVEATKIAMARQKELCPAGFTANGSRPGKLISTGICVNGSEAAPMLTMVEMGLRGAVLVPFGGEPNAYQTQVDITKPLNGSITDLKTQMPQSFDACGNATQLADETLGGLFPNGDATVAVRKNNGNFLNKVCR